MVPKELEVNQKVVYVDKNSGEKAYASTPASVKYLPDKTEIKRSASDLRAFQSYRFDW